MNTYNRNRLYRRSGESAESMESNSSRGSSNGSRRSNGSKRYSTLKTAKVREYPRTYKQYRKSTTDVKPNEIISAREFIKPQQFINFTAHAKSIIGGVDADMRGSLKICTSGKRFFNLFNTTHNFVKAHNAKISVYASEDDQEYEDEALLEIPYVELRSLFYSGDREFRIVFNSMGENAVAQYLPHTLKFLAPTKEIAEDWIKAVFIGCINTAMFLESTIEFLNQHNLNTNEKKLSLLRQIVDLYAIGYGLTNKKTINAQVELGKTLSEKEEQQEEAEFWLNMATNNANSRDSNTLLSSIQKSLVDSIKRSNTVELNNDYEDDNRIRRNGSFMLARMFF